VLQIAHHWFAGHESQSGYPMPHSYSPYQAGATVIKRRVVSQPTKHYNLITVQLDWLGRTLSCMDGYANIIHDHSTIKHTNAISTYHTNRSEQIHVMAIANVNHMCVV